jgi:hypothetical protein
MCTCTEPDADLNRPAYHESNCPVYVWRCEACDGKGYVFGAPPSANMPVGAWDCQACGATGQSQEVV